MDETKLWRVTFRSGNTIRTGDMVFIDGTPHVVWEWHQDAANEYPGVTTKLDRRHLQTDRAHLPPGIDAVYGRDVPDPRPSS